MAMASFPIFSDTESASGFQAGFKKPLLKERGRLQDVGQKFKRGFPQQKFTPVSSSENVINPVGKGPVDGGKLKQIQKQEKRKQEIDASMQMMMDQHPEELTDYAREFGRPADGQKDAAEWWYPEKQLQEDLKTMYAGIEKTVNGPCRRRGFRDVTNVSTEDLPWEEIPEPVLEPFDF